MAQLKPNGMGALKARLHTRTFSKISTVRQEPQKKNQYEEHTSRSNAFQLPFVIVVVVVVTICCFPK